MIKQDSGTLLQKMFLSPDGGTLVVGTFPTSKGIDEDNYLVAADTLTRGRSLKGRLKHVCWLSDSERLLFLTGDLSGASEAVIGKRADDSEDKTIATKLPAMWTFACSKDGSAFALIDTSGRLEIHRPGQEPARQEIPFVPDMHSGKLLITSLAFTDEGQLVASYQAPSADPLSSAPPAGEIVINTYSSADGKLQSEARVAQGGPMIHHQLSAGRRSLFGFGLTGLTIWEYGWDGKLKQEIPVKSPSAMGEPQGFATMTVSENGLWILGTSRGGRGVPARMFLVDVGSRTARYRLPVDYGATAARPAGLSNDGKRIAAGAASILSNDLAVWTVP